MGKRLCQVFLFAILLIYPATVSASGFDLHINITRQSDGVANGEIWYNGNVFWRIMLLPDGAKPAMGMASEKTTIIIPEISNGLFMLKVYNN